MSRARSERKTDPETGEELKYCPECKEHWPEDDFCHDKTRWNGLGTYCAGCRLKQVAGRSVLRKIDPVIEEFPCKVCGTLSDSEICLVCREKKITREVKLNLYPAIEKEEVKRLEDFDSPDLTLAQLGAMAIGRGARKYRRCWEIR